MVAENAADVRVNGKKIVCSIDNESTMLKHREPSFDGSMNAVKKELSAARVEKVALWYNQDEVLSKTEGAGDWPLVTLESRVRTNF